MEFFEIRFRFISHDLNQKDSLLMFMSQVSYVHKTPATIEASQQFGKDFLSLIYEQQSLVLRLNLGQGANKRKSISLEINSYL